MGTNEYDAALMKDVKKFCSLDSGLSLRVTNTLPFFQSCFHSLSLSFFFFGHIEHRPLLCTPRYIISYITQFIMCISFRCIYALLAVDIGIQEHTHTLTRTHKYATLQKIISML